ncbi:lipase family protein [Nocardia sp. 348MFTsu5.1]|uniref:lipase family protein n=1 Tax=Nocardia sp. 348MFTsu5.1 TaxID=1172185 RepID=UPI000372F2C8|nr:lipase family protein [Nocardia sp. 348MFTsu5.1]
MAFDALFARDVALPLAQAAYDASNGRPLALPPGFVQTALIEPDNTARTALTAMTDSHPAVRAMTRDNLVFGLMGQNTGTRTAFVSFRGTQHLEEWVRNVDAEPQEYIPIPGFGKVHEGFQATYHLVRNSIAANLAAACTDCDQILLTGHSLGAALAVLAAPDIFSNMPPNTLEPRLITFAGPRVGLNDFVTSFNTAIESCYRVVNFLDIVPHVPLAPYTHVGAQIAVDSDGPIDLIWRHALPAYRAGLTKSIATHP